MRKQKNPKTSLINIVRFFSFRLWKEVWTNSLKFITYFRVSEFRCLLSTFFNSVPRFDSDYFTTVLFKSVSRRWVIRVEKIEGKSWMETRYESNLSRLATVMDIFGKKSCILIRSGFFFCIIGFVCLERCEKYFKKSRLVVGNLLYKNFWLIFYVWFSKIINSVFSLIRNDRRHQ